MTTFSKGEPIYTREPTIRVDELREGAHRFQLEVENGDGRVSAPDVVTVQVQAGRSGGTRPT
jgi:hypothetical protein